MQEREMNRFDTERNPFPVKSVGKKLGNHHLGPDQHLARQCRHARQRDEGSLNNHHNHLDDGSDTSIISAATGDGGMVHGRKGKDEEMKYKHYYKDTDTDKDKEKEKEKDARSKRTKALADVSKEKGRTKQDDKDKEKDTRGARTRTRTKLAPLKRLGPLLFEPGGEEELCLSLSSPKCPADGVDGGCCCGDDSDEIDPSVGNTPRSGDGQFWTRTRTRTKTWTTTRTSKLHPSSHRHHDDGREPSSRPTDAIPAPAAAAADVRHEALEELAASVRDLRAEVHGRPSLSDRRFSSFRNNFGAVGTTRGGNGLNESTFNLAADIEGILDSLMEEGDGNRRGGGGGGGGGDSDDDDDDNVISKDDDDDDDDDDDVGNGRREHPRRRRRRRRSRRDKLSNADGSADADGLERRQRRLSLREDMFVAAVNSSSFASDAVPAPRKQSSPPSLCTNQTHQKRLSPPPSYSRSPQTPHEAAELTVESVYSLVSALYRLLNATVASSSGSKINHSSSSSSLLNPPFVSIAARVLELTPAVDLAFGSIKPIISALAYESDFRLEEEERAYRRELESSFPPVRPGEDVDYEGWTPEGRGEKEGEKGDETNGGDSEDSEDCRGPERLQGRSRGSEPRHGQSWQPDDSIDNDNDNDNDNVDEEEEEEESARRLKKHLVAASRLLDAMAESVQRIADITGSCLTSLSHPPTKGAGTIALAGANVTLRKLSEAECVYVTLLEILGMTCSDLSAASDAYDCAVAMDYCRPIPPPAAASRPTGRGAGDVLFDFEQRDRSSDKDEDSIEETATWWELSRTIRGNWMAAGHGDKIFALENHTFDPSLASGSSSFSRPTDGGGNGSEDRRGTDRQSWSLKIVKVEPDLLRELSLAVLSRLEWKPQKWERAVDLPEERTLLNRIKARAAKSGKKASSASVRGLGDGNADADADADAKEQQTATATATATATIEDALTLCRLGDIKVSAMENDSALAHYEEALRIARIHNDNHGPLVAAILEAIGNVHRLAQRYDVADSHFYDAMSALKRSLPPKSESPGKAKATKATEGLFSLLLSWCRLKTDRGDRSGALALLDRRLSAQREVLGEDDPEVASTLYQQGWLCMDLELAEAASDRFTESLRIRREALGPDHPSVGDSFFALGLLKCTLAQQQSAAAAGGGALATDDDDVDDSYSVDNLWGSGEGATGGGSGGGLGLGTCASSSWSSSWSSAPRRANNRRDEALEFLWDALRIRRHHGTDRLREAETLAVIGNIHRNSGQSETAARLYGECLKLRVECLGPNHVQVSEVHVALGYVHDELKNFGDAVQHYRTALSIMKEKYGEADERVLNVTRLLGNTEFLGGNLIRALVNLERYVDLKRKAKDDQSLDVVDAMHLLGKIRYALGDVEKARSTLSEAQKIYAVNNHASRRTSVGKGLIESLRMLDASDLGGSEDEASINADDDEDDDDDEENEDEDTNMVLSFIRRMNRSMSMEQATTSDHNSDRLWPDMHGSESRAGSILSNARAKSKINTSHGRKQSIEIPTRKQSAPYGRRVSSKSSMDVSSSSVGSTGGFGSRRKGNAVQQHADDSFSVSSLGRAGRKERMDFNGSTTSLGRVQSLGRYVKKERADFGGSATSLGHASSSNFGALPSSCPAVASAQKLSSSCASLPVVAGEHLWGSMELKEEDLPELFSDQVWDGNNTSDGVERQNHQYLAKNEGGPLRLFNPQRSPSIVSAVRAAHNSLQNKIMAFCDAEVAQQRLQRANQ